MYNTMGLMRENYNKFYQSLCLLFLDFRRCLLGLRDLDLLCGDLDLDLDRRDLLGLKIE